MSVDIEDLRDITVVDLVTVGAFETYHVIVQLKTAHLGKLKKLLEWFRSLNDPDYLAWFNLTKEQLQDFIIGRINVTDLSDQDTFHTMTEPDPRPNIVVPSTATAMGIGSGLLFGVKRSISDYPKLREDKGWLPFKCGLVATAATHALSEVLDPQYIPLTNDEIV